MRSLSANFGPVLIVKIKHKVGSEFLEIVVMIKITFCIFKRLITFSRFYVFLFTAIEDFPESEQETIRKWRGDVAIANSEECENQGKTVCF